MRNEARWLHGRGGGEANSPTRNSNYSIDIPHTITLSSLICITSLAVPQQMNAGVRVGRHVGEKVLSRPLAAVASLQIEGGAGCVKSWGHRGSTVFVS